MPPLRVVLAANQLGLGGTEKSLVNHALAFDRTRVSPQVLAIYKPGPRFEEVKAAGIPVSVAGSDPKRTRDLLEGADVVHVYRAGGAERLLPDAVRAVGSLPMVETNVFGHLDPAPERNQFACHLFMSQHSAMRYRARIGMDLGTFFGRHRVSYNPIDVERLRRLAPAPEEARSRLGLDPHRPVVARVGRADDRKWGLIVVEMLPELVRRVPEVQVLLVGATDRIRRRLAQRGIRAHVALIEPTADEGRLAAIFAATSVMITASSIGESFGSALAEAMALGVPVVTPSTPWADNGQVEVLDHAVTGYLANHPQTFAEAVADLLGDPNKLTRFGQASAEKARAQWEVGRLTRQLETLYETLVNRGESPSEWSPSCQEMADYEAEYAQRAAAQFRPLTRRESFQVRTAVIQERARWVVLDVRGAPVERSRAIMTLVWSRMRQAFRRKASQSSLGIVRKSSDSAR